MHRELTHLLIPKSLQRLLFVLLGTVISGLQKQDQSSMQINMAASGRKHTLDC